ncbi:hypothetical protein BcDW1_9475 [Botrytis cinerea BcDW1]|uniref:non-specific serine/threonine protein kinase n=1 Tax=Botryotinia fuckeliana (strain BcDW1) TaxID=1290391 RepID=M7TKJ7_BOTF1|nr:hypothetical protein BcDW1_9475 [Botrytis cinerea BcDW1]
MPLQVLPLVENLQKISQRFLEEIGLRSANPAPLPPAKPSNPDDRIPPDPSANPPDDPSDHSSYHTPDPSSSSSNSDSFHTPPSPDQESSLSKRDIRESEARLAHFYQSLKKTPKSIRRNKWREDPRLGGLKNQVFEGILGVGGFGSVFLVLNTLTQKRSPTLIATRNLLSKRYRENRCHLQYIKSGHPHICALDAFLDFTSQFGAQEERGMVMFASYYEYCDGGDLYRILRGYQEGHQLLDLAVQRRHMVRIANLGRQMRHEEYLQVPALHDRHYPPELFLWHIFSQLISAILFLHNEHPDYNTRPEHKNRGMIITMDLAPQNVFLKWPPHASTLEARSKVYPDIKVGDFGTANFLPPGGRIDAEEGGDDGTTPDKDYYDAQTDVWTVGLMIYNFATRPPVVDAAEEILGVPSAPVKKVAPAVKGDIAGNYSAQLNKVIRAAMKDEREKRIEEKKLGRILQEGYKIRIPLMFKSLPDWAISQEKVLKYRFSEGHVRELWERDWNLAIAEEEAAEAAAVEDEERVYNLMLLVKERKLRFGIELDEDESDDEQHPTWIQGLRDENPELYAELLAEAKLKVPSPKVPGLGKKVPSPEVMDSGESEEDLA